MKKIFTLLALTCAVGLSASAQGVFGVSPSQHVRGIEAPASRAVSHEWLSFTTYTPPSIPSSAAPLGVGEGIFLEVGSLFSVSYLDSYKGEDIYALAMAFNSYIEEVEMVVLSGTNYTTATMLASVKGAVVPGWNFFKLSSPVHIDGEAPLMIVGKFIDNGEYPILFDRARRNSAASGVILRLENENSAADSGWGNPMVAAMLDNDFSDMNSRLGLGTIKFEPYMPIGDAAKMEVVVVNAGFDNVTSYSFSYKVDNGEVKTVDVTTDSPIEPGKTGSYTVELGTLGEKMNVDINLTSVNGGTNNIDDFNTTTSITINGYDPNATGERKSLLEKFTGQTCGNCPGGEQAIQAAIPPYRHRLVRVNHHDGYTVDMFTLSGSTSIVSNFGVRGAPSMMLDRAVQSSRSKLPSDQRSVVWHPGYITPAIIEEALSVGSAAEIEVAAEVIEGKDLSIVVTGKKTSTIADPMLTVVLTAGGVRGYQASGGSNYEFNDFPIVFLTAALGDSMEFDANDEFRYEYTYTVQDEYGNTRGNFTIDMNTIKAVAFIADGRNRTTSPVINANDCQLSGTNGIDGPVVNEGGLLYTVDGMVHCTTEGATLEVFDLNGKAMANGSLTTGIYVVRKTINGNTSVDKVAVR